MNKHELCKKLEEVEKGLDYQDTVITAVQKTMLVYKRKQINLNHHYMQSRCDIVSLLDQHPILIDKLTEFGFTVKKVPIETNRLVSTKELVGKKFFGLLNRYKTVEKLETIQMGGETYMFSICCEETK